MSEDCHDSNNAPSDTALPWCDHKSLSAYAMVAPLLLEYKRAAKIMDLRREMTPWKLLFDLGRSIRVG